MGNFGFFGKKVERLSQIDAPGRVISGPLTRIFAIALSHITNGRTRFYFEYDGTNTGSTPNFKNLTGTSEAFDTDSRAISASALTQLANDDTRKYIFVPGTAGQFTYSSTAALSPANRKVNVIIPRPELISGLGFWQSGAGSGSFFNGAFRMPDLPNCEYLYFVNGSGANDYCAITSFTGYMPRNLKAFVCSPLTTGVNFTMADSCKFSSALLALSITPNSITNLATLIADCVNLKTFQLGNQNIPIEARSYASIATLDISHITGLEALMVGSSTLTSFTYNFSANTLLVAHIDNVTGLSNANFLTLVNSLLAITTLKWFNLRNSNRTISKTFVDGDFKSTLTNFYIYGNIITGNLTLTTAKPSLLEFRTGSVVLNISDATKNNMSVVNVIGLTNSVLIDVSNGLTNDLTLPVNTVCTSLYVGGNNLSVTTNSNLIAQVNAMTALTDLRFSTGSGSITSIISGQGSSVDGIGTNPNFSGLNLTIFFAQYSKITGTLTLKSTVVLLIAGDNPAMTSLLSNLGTFSALTSINIINCTSLNFNFTTVPICASYLVANTGSTLFDLSGRTATTSIAVLDSRNCASLVTANLPSIAARAVINSSISSNQINFSGCALLTSISDLDKISYSTLTSVIARALTCNGSALNIDFKIGISNFLPTDIQVQNNAMSNANVNLNIDNIYQNRSKWNTTIVAKSLNIAGTNAAPTGTYAAPAGFVLGGSDGTPTTAKEQAYVLVNNYGWTITMN